MNIIFLDIDGVLNAEDDFGPGNNNPHIGHNRGISTSKVKLLKEIVDASNASLVLVSSWKKRYIKYLNNKEDEVGEYLFNKLNEVGLSIYDTTSKYDYDDGKSRGVEIALWLIDHKNEFDKYIVLDDDERIDYEKYNVLPRLVKTSPLTGLTKDIVEECIEKLY